MLVSYATLAKRWDMNKRSVPKAAEKLGLSPIRISQRCIRFHLEQVQLAEQAGSQPQTSKPARFAV